MTKVNLTPLIVIDALSYKTVSKLDSSGRILYQRAADGGVVAWTRDAAGRVATVSDQLGYVTTYTRDAAGFVTRTDLPDGNYTSATYQASAPTSFHRMLTSRDERGYVTTMTYDGANGHLLTITNALSQVATYAFRHNASAAESLRREAVRLFD